MVLFYHYWSQQYYNQLPGKLGQMFKLDSDILIWVPRVSPKDSIYDKFIGSFLKETEWRCLREMYEVSPPVCNSSGYFQISSSSSSSIDNVQHVFIWLKKSYRDASGSQQNENSPYTANTFGLDGASLTNCRLEFGNGVNRNRI